MFWKKLQREYCLAVGKKKKKSCGMLISCFKSISQFTSRCYGVTVDTYIQGSEDIRNYTWKGMPDTEIVFFKLWRIQWECFLEVSADVSAKCTW